MDHKFIELLQFLAFEIQAELINHAFFIKTPRSSLQLLKKQGSFIKASRIAQFVVEVLEQTCLHSSHLVKIYIWLIHPQKIMIPQLIPLAQSRKFSHQNIIFFNLFLNLLKFDKFLWIDNIIKKILFNLMEITLQTINIGIVLFYTAFGWLVLTGIKINYGRLSSSLSSIYINPKFGWFFFQVPNLLWAAYFLFYKGDSLSFAFVLFIIHYINRDIIYPLSLNTSTKVPLEILLSAFSFTFANGYLQGIANSESIEVSNIQKTIGFLLFVIGMSINIYSDKILQNIKAKLSKQKQGKYVKIDQFLFKYISNPNYFGEIIEWVGYSLVSGHIYAFMFAFSTINVLTPAAIVRNKWNKKNIANYPQERKAVFPFIL